MYVKNLALLFFYLFLGINLSTAGLLKCNYAGNFTSNSTYGKNLDLILSSLPDNVSRNDGFFYMTTVDQGLNQVYALALCRGDTSSGDCSNCVSLRVREIKASCPNQTEAIVWEGDVVCLVRYADRSIFGTLELRPSQADYNVKTVIDFTSNVVQFYKKWNNLMDGLVEKASHGSYRLKFGTGITDVDSGKIYALMQCTPDISQKECKECLKETVGQYQSCCRSYQGGYVLKPNCHFRWDLYSFFNSSADTLYLAQSPPPPPTPNSTTNRNTRREDNGGLESHYVAIIVVSIVISIAILGLACILLRKRNKRKQENISKLRKKESIDTSFCQDAEDNDSVKSLLFDFRAIKVSTDNFSVNNKLGQGGFGTVYKGRLPDGQNIAVKRLSENSVQGDLEFKNEVLLMAKLQHRNLVRLLGFSLEGKERLLIYEFLPNSSLNHFLFGGNWDKRHKIITGIARGILYLHEDSQYRIVHRDIKAANILLDEAMKPKIADFGLARLFSGDQSHYATIKPAGTFGYMAPEYIKHETYSVKSDIYSFGVLVLEIITGERISRSLSKEGEDLLTHAWRSWKTGTMIYMVDPTLRDGSKMEIMRCFHIGLLCVQENVPSRPTMNSVVLMLSSCAVSLPSPSRPGFVNSALEPCQITENEASISELDPR